MYNEPRHKKRTFVLSENNIRIEGIGIDPINLQIPTQAPGPEVIKHFSCLSQLSIKFKQLISFEIAQIYHYQVKG